MNNSWNRFVHAISNYALLVGPTEECSVKEIGEDYCLSFKITLIFYICNSGEHFVGV